jgi:hypothetical protein
MIKIVIFALLGKLTIYLAQQFPFIQLPLIGRYWKEKRFLGKLFACDLCLGVWIYTLSALLLKVNLFEEFGYIPIVFEFFTGAAMSFIMHLLTIGWRDKFGVIRIGD